MKQEQSETIPSLRSVVSGENCFSLSLSFEGEIALYFPPGRKNEEGIPRFVNFEGIKRRNSPLRLLTIY